MKTLTTMIALLLAGATSYANTFTTNPISPKKKVAIVQNVSSKIKLVYLDKEKGDVTINILDDGGKSLHRNVVQNQAGFTQQFDFATLPDGNYTFQITQPNGEEVIEKVRLDKSEKQVSFQADLLNVNDKNKFRLVVLNNSTPVTVRIMDSKDQVLHEETISELNGFRKTYDIQNSDNQDVRFELNCNNQMVSLFTK